MKLILLHLLSTLTNENFKRFYKQRNLIFRMKDIFNPKI